MLGIKYLNEGISESHSVKKNNIAFLKVIDGLSKTIFATLEIGGILFKFSNISFLRMKEIEFWGMVTLIPFKIYYIAEKGKPESAILKTIEYAISLFRSGMELNLFKEKYYLDLPPEQRENEKRLLRISIDEYNTRYEEVPIVVEECQENLESLKKSSLIFSLFENAIQLMSTNLPRLFKKFIS